VADDTTRAINRFFDAVDNGVDAASRVLNRTQRTEEQIREKHGKRRVVIDVKPSEKPQASSSPSASTAVAKRPRHRILESVDPKSGCTIFVVTDGGASRAECTTRELAEQILRAMEKVP
jgi:hypothetical protein